MKRCLIIDDDPLSRLALERIIQQSGHAELARSYESPAEALLFLKEHPVDVLFLDVEMPEMTGLEFIALLKNPPAIILVTSQEKYAVEAFDFDVVDYLVKPVTLPRFIKALARVPDKHPGVSSDGASSTDPTAVFVKVGSQLQKIPVADILWIEATGDYAKIYTERDSYIADTTLKVLLQKLPSGNFAQVHRSHIVQVAKIKAIEGNLVIIGKHLIPISDSYRAAFMKRINRL